MDTAVKPSWAASAATAMHRILQRQGPAPETRDSPAKPAGGPPLELEPPRELPPLDFFTGKPVEALSTSGRAARDPLPPPEAVAPAHSVETLDDPARQRIRDAYVAARFPGVARSSLDLVNVRRTIDAAHLYFEDGNVHRAAELLELAAEIQPTAEKLWLASLELAFRTRDAEAYRRAATGLRRFHPESRAWPEVAAFARTLCLTDEPFAAGDCVEPLVGDAVPRKPRWLSDPWELEPEFGPADVRAHVLDDECDNRRAA